ncbi:hypothetical protein GCM10023321_79660 [Pseudonocardia eucalypti]|uniref:Solute-binding protein family 3/N-terminal domain-containing protein n=1 Tax=Pseudonocardia eucalypti TaxID=648755 RepID=A0ABP9RDB2_9PSEU|nr:polar amino acid transport system substrate-binding protein [Pseudonocardia eucalypti]
MRTRALAGAAALLAVALSGCAGGAETDAAADVITTGPVPSVAALVPPEVRAKGVLTAVMSVGNAPVHYPAPDGSGNMLGFDPDLANVLGQTMDLPVRVVGVTFDQIVPGLQSGRYDISVSMMAITPERLKVLDFVEYFVSGTGLGTRAGNPKQITVATMCGRSVGVSNGSVQQAKYLPDMSRKCQASGRPPIDIRNFPDQQKGVLALVSGRIDAVFVDLPVLRYAAKNVPDIMVADSYDAGSSVGIGLAKGSPLTPAIEAALTELNRSGIYTRVLAKWAVEGNALHTFATRK